MVAGVGNIFRAEVLFETELDPRIPGKSLSEESFDLFWKLLTRLMRVGLRHGRIIAVTAREAGLPLAKVPDNRRFRVHGRTECPLCGQTISSIEVAGRWLYVCESCQTRKR